MANKRLSKLQSSALEPSELDLADEDVNELTVSGVLSLTTEENMPCLFPNGKERTNSVDSASDESQDEKDGDPDNSYEHVKSISSLNTSISRGLSISIIKQKTAKVKFDIVETRITGRRKHVLYTLVVTKTPGVDSDKAIIERRYSEFSKLYKELKKSFPEFMEKIEFPEKRMYGNLKDSLIRERSRLLQEFIQKIHENEDVRNSDIFKTFFYISSLQQGCKYICGGMFEQALNFLLNGLHLQQKLALDSTNEVIATLCSIVECYTSLRSHDEVVKYSNAALELIGDDMSSVYLVPLLQTLKNAYVVLGENTADVESRLRDIVSINQIEIEHLPSLRELSVKRFANK